MNKPSDVRPKRTPNGASVRFGSGRNIKRGDVKGRLLVFEGPDGVGKTSMAFAVEQRFRKIGLKAERFSFPGQTSGTLGKHIYDLYHTPEKFGISEMHVNTEQALFTAAHVETIETQVLPALASGSNVILDRYWWSTWVYATASGICPSVRDTLIRLEEIVWKGAMPACVFYVRRPAPVNYTGDIGKWERLRKLYDELSRTQAERVKIVDVHNTASLDDAISTVSGIATSMVRRSHLGIKMNGF